MFEAFKLISYMQAEKEGKLPEWYLKQILLWAVRILVKLPFKILGKLISLLVILPVGFIWRYTAHAGRRTCDTVEHLIRFFFGFVLYFLIVFGGLIYLFAGLISKSS